MNKQQLLRLYQLEEHIKRVSYELCQLKEESVELTQKIDDLDAKRVNLESSFNNLLVKSTAGLRDGEKLQ